MWQLAHVIFLSVDDRSLKTASFLSYFFHQSWASPNFFLPELKTFQYYPTTYPKAVSFLCILSDKIHSRLST
jgi:hypothetical protein